MDGSASLRVEDDQGTRPNSPASVEGGQASHAPPMSEPKQVAGGTMGILQQLAQALQRSEQPAAITPKQSAIERMARYRPVDFMRKKSVVGLKTVLMTIFEPMSQHFAMRISPKL